MGNRVIQMRRLDIAFWNINAQLAFPDAKVVNLLRLHFDHNLVLFISEAGRPPERHLLPIASKQLVCLESTTVISGGMPHVTGIDVLRI